MKKISKYCLSFALFFVGTINAYGYTIGTNSATFTSSDEITIVFPAEALQFAFQNVNSVFPSNINLTLTDSEGRKYFVITMGNGTLSANGQHSFHWQTSSGWNHAGIEWYEISNSANSATNSFPVPDQEGYKTIFITLDGSGNTVVTWSTDEITPGSTPGGGSDSGTAGESGFSSREHETAEGNGVVGDKVDCGDCYGHAY